MAITPLNEETAGPLIQIVDALSVVTLAAEYAAEQVQAGNFTQEQSQAYMRRAQERLQEREKTYKDEHTYIWPDHSKHSLFLAEAFNAALEILGARLTREDASSLNTLLRELDQHIDQARGMRDRGELRDKAVLALETVKIAATSEKPLTVPEAHAFAKRQK